MDLAHLESTVDRFGTRPALTVSSGALIASLRHGLIVSCQAEDDDPFNHPERIALIARAVEMGGAIAIRAREAENIRSIRQAVSIPIIGLTKGQYPDGRVLITPDFPDVEAIVRAGANIVAVDATSRRRPNGLTGGQFTAAVKERWKCLVVADISTFDEALEATKVGADFVATTLSGYTGGSPLHRDPDWNLLASLTRALSAPVILEGRVWTPRQARHALDLGAFAVVVGTAITRPRIITRAFVEGMKSPQRTSRAQTETL